MGLQMDFKIFGIFLIVIVIFTSVIIGYSPKRVKKSSIVLLSLQIILFSIIAYCVISGIADYKAEIDYSSSNPGAGGADFLGSLMIKAFLAIITAFLSLAGIVLSSINIKNENNSVIRISSVIFLVLFILCISCSMFIYLK